MRVEGACGLEGPRQPARGGSEGGWQAFRIVVKSSALAVCFTSSGALAGYRIALRLIDKMGIIIPLNTVTGTVFVLSLLLNGKEGDSYVLGIKSE